MSGKNLDPIRLLGPGGLLAATLRDSDAFTVVFTMKGDTRTVREGAVLEVLDDAVKVQEYVDPTRRRYRTPWIMFDAIATLEILEG